MNIFFGFPGNFIAKTTFKTLKKSANKFIKVLKLKIMQTFRDVNRG